MSTTQQETPAGFARQAILVLALAAALAAIDSRAEAPEAAAEAAGLKSPRDRQNYALGIMAAKQLRKQSVELEPEAFMQGLKDGAADGEPQLSQSEIAEVALNLHNEMKRKQAEAQVEKRHKNKAEGEAFLAENKAREGVVTLASGLQYKVLKAGEGRKPTADEAVVVRYRGTLVDGTEFASTERNGEPKTLLLKKAIPGWREALPLMAVGSKWQVVVPAHLAYGKRSAGKAIGPNSTLVFEVELVDVKDASAATTAAAPEPGESETGAGPGKAGKSAAAPPVAAINVAYKLDPRLTKSLYMGERWVAPPTYTAVQDEKGLTVEVRARAVDARGSEVGITPVWEAGDAGIVQVSPAQGKDVTLTVLKEGRSELLVSAAGVSRKLTLHSVRRNDVLQLEITQQ